MCSAGRAGNRASSVSGNIRPAVLMRAEESSRRVASRNVAIRARLVRRFLGCFGLVLTIACLVGCHRPAGTVLGKAPSGPVQTIIGVRGGDTAPKVNLHGTMVEKCPVAGCWFYLQDETGVIKVDTKAAGFVVVNVPLQTQVTVGGTVVNQSEDVTIQATGIRY